MITIDNIPNRYETEIIINFGKTYVNGTDDNIIISEPNGLISDIGYKDIWNNHEIDLYKNDFGDFE